MLFDDCGCCNCGYRVQILPSGFSGAIANDDANRHLVDLFIRSMSVKLEDEDGDPVLARPLPSPTPVELAAGLRLISDDDYVELEFEQSPGHVLRMTFEGQNTLLDSDDPVTLTVEEDSLDDTPWPQDVFGRDYLARSSPTWQVRVVKPTSPCRCRDCYCGQEADPIDLENAPAAYSLQFVEGFADDESPLFGPGLPFPFFLFAPGGPHVTPACYDVCAPGNCVPEVSRWAQPFSLKKMTAGELAAAGLDSNWLAYASDEIPVNSCETIRYLFIPCSAFGFARLKILGGASYVAAATGPRPGWRFEDYADAPGAYQTDLFDNPVDFGVAVLTASETHEEFINEECPGRATDVPEEMIVEFYGESCGGDDCEDVPNPADIGGSYTLALDAENSTECLAIWEYAEDTAFPNLGDGDLFQEQPTLRIRLECHNNTGGVDCLCDGGTWYLTVEGLSPEYLSRTEGLGGELISRMPWFFGQTYKVDPGDIAAYPFVFGILAFSDEYAGDDAACYSPCQEDLLLDQPEEEIAGTGVMVGRLITFAKPAIGFPGIPGAFYPGFDPDTGVLLPGQPPANGPRMYRGLAGYKIYPG